MKRLRSSRDALSLHEELNDTAAAYPEDSSVPEIFEDNAMRRPGAIAVVHGDRGVTYREFNEWANGVAADLMRRGVRRGEVVGVCFDRTPELLVVLLALLKCGATYLPVDPSWPDERLAVVFAEARCGRLVTDRVSALAHRFPRCSVSGISAVVRSDRNPVVPIGPADTAYVMFTSGSTGVPKGVPVRHRSILNLVSNADYAPLTEHAVLLQLAPVFFDASTFEIWGALLRGGTCVLYPSPFVTLSELGRVIVAHGVSVVFLTTVLFNTIVDEAPAVLDDVGTILTGGEAHSLKHIEFALARYGPGKLTSVYGPTECTTFSTYHPVREVPAGETSLPIGLPLRNVRTYVVDGDRLCEAEQTGELLVGGPGVSAGYLGDRAASSGSFEDYDVGGVRERLYRTGDRVRIRRDRVLTFHGRTDDQVKINGFRIELGEVAHHLDRCPGVRRSCVVVDTVASGKVLIAFVVPDDESCTPDTVLAELGKRLPRYMLPSTVYLRDSLPLTGTSKVDRRALLADPSATGSLTP